MQRTAGQAPRVLPDFLILGAQKSGTTWLAHKLRQHPDVWLPRSEIHYFDKDYNYAKGMAWYQAHFVDAQPGSLIGEKTPDYLWANGIGVEGHMPDVHRYIYEALPDAKLIVSLRNPVERAISAVNHVIRSGRISPLHAIDDLLVGSKQSLVEGHGVIDYGRYHRQLEAYLEYFERCQMLILVFEEDIVQRPTAGLTKACEFLGVDPTFEFTAVHERSNPYRYSKVGLILRYYLRFPARLIRWIDQVFPVHKARPSNAVLGKLYDVYAMENERLFASLERDMPVSWKNSP
jgi:hypothetical protein